MNWLGLVALLFSFAVAFYSRTTYIKVLESQIATQVAEEEAAEALEEVKEAVEKFEGEFTNRSQFMNQQHEFNVQVGAATGLEAPPKLATEFPVAKRKKQAWRKPND